MSKEQATHGAVRRSASPGRGARTRPAEDSPEAGYRRMIAHDIRRELSTIMLLASALLTATDIGQESRVRARQLLGEARWMDELLHAYDAAVTGGVGAHPDGFIPIRLDELGLCIEGCFSA